MYEYDVTYMMREQLQRLKAYQEFNPFAELYASQAIEIARNLMRPIVTSAPVDNIEDAAAVKVGEIYNFWVVRADNFMGLDFPILGPLTPHCDAEIPEMTAGDPHWHVDWRALPDKLHQIVARAYGKACGAAPEDLQSLLMHVLLSPKQCSKPERRALRCARLHSRFSRVAYLPALEKLNEGQRVECDICPHRGFSLVGAVEDEKGRYCPGHGLLWSRKGELVKQ